MPKFIAHVADRNSRQLIESNSNATLADYESSLLVEADQAQFDQLKQEGIRVREISSNPIVQINAYSIDTSMLSAKAPMVASAERAAISPATARRKHLIVCFAGPSHPSWVREIEEMGGTIHCGLGAYAFLVSLSEPQMAALSAKPYVESVSPYLPQFKIAEELVTPAVDSTFRPSDAVRLVGSLADSPRVVADAPLERHRGISRVPQTQNGNIRITVFDSEARDEVVRQLQDANLDVVEVSDRAIIVNARIDNVRQIAEIPEVQQIQRNFPRVLHNNVATAITRAEDLRNHHNLDGAGVTVAVADTGIDTGNTANMSGDFANRITSIRALGRPGNARDPDGHGTHVAGSILGSGANSNRTVQGLAPEASLVFQSVLDANGGLGGLPLNLNDLFRQAADDGAQIHNNSWGERFSDGAYTSSSEQLDEFAFQNRDFLVVVSAGNDAPRRVTAPGTAKNALTVGASESLRTLPSIVTFPASPRFSSGPSLTGLDGEADSENQIADFSSPGPAESNRRKPDVVAPGTWILSCRSSVAVADVGSDGLAGLTPTFQFPDGGTGDEDGIPSHDEAVGLGIPGQPIMFAGNANAPPMPIGSGNGAANAYMYQSGTSMASPITAGACALLRQYFQRERNHNASAALIKACVINGARDTGNGVPNNSQGWGRVDLTESIGTQDHPIMFDDDLQHAVSTMQVREFRANLEDTTAPVSVTLVWRDRMGTLIQNQLLLTVFDGDQTNAFSSDPISDIRNNVQKVVLPSVANSFIRIEVEGVNVSFGIPDHGDGIAQDFALVVSNVSDLEMA